MVIKSNLTEFKIWKYAFLFLIILTLFLRFYNFKIVKSENFLDHEITELKNQIRLGSNKEIDHLIDFIKAAENTPNIFYIKEIYYSKNDKEITFTLKGNINKKILKDLGVNHKSWLIIKDKKNGEYKLIKKF